MCLMQKAIDKGPELQIRSAIALDHLKNYIYIEADKEAHVREVSAHEYVDSAGPTELQRCRPVIVVFCK